MSRLHHLWRSLIAPLWAWFIAGALGLFGSADWLIEKVNPSYHSPLPNWNWQTWTILALLVLFAVLFEGSYRQVTRARVEAIEDARPPVPDMSVHDVFYLHLGDVDIETKNWDAFGLHLMDYLSTGQLKAWGRNSLGSGVDPPFGPLVEIPMKFWPSSRWTFWFLDPSTDHDSPHVEGRNAFMGHIYGDVRFNRRQIEELLTVERDRWLGPRKPYNPLDALDL